MNFIAAIFNSRKVLSVLFIIKNKKQMYRTVLAATLAVVIQAAQLTTQVEDLMMDQLNFARESELAQVAAKLEVVEDSQLA